MNPGLGVLPRTEVPALPVDVHSAHVSVKASTTGLEGGETLLGSVPAVEGRPVADEQSEAGRGLDGRLPVVGRRPGVEVGFLVGAIEVPMAGLTQYIVGLVKMWSIGNTSSKVAYRSLHVFQRFKIQASKPIGASIDFVGPVLDQSPEVGGAQSVSLVLVVEVGGETGRLQPGDEIVQNGLVDVDGEWLKWPTGLGSDHRDVLAEYWSVRIEPFGHEWRECLRANR